MAPAVSGELLGCRPRLEDGGVVRGAGRTPGWTAACCRICAVEFRGDPSYTSAGCAPSLLPLICQGCNQRRPGRRATLYTCSSPIREGWLDRLDLSSCSQSILSLPLICQRMWHPIAIVPLDSAPPVIPISGAFSSSSASSCRWSPFSAVSARAEIAQSRSSRAVSPAPGRLVQPRREGPPRQLSRPCVTYCRHRSLGFPGLLAGPQEAPERTEEASQALPSQ